MCGQPASSATWPTWLSIQWTSSTCQGWRTWWLMPRVSRWWWQLWCTSPRLYKALQLGSAGYSTDHVRGSGCPMSQEVTSPRSCPCPGGGISGVVRCLLGRVAASGLKKDFRKKVFDAIHSWCTQGHMPPSGLCGQGWLETSGSGAGREWPAAGPR